MAVQLLSGLARAGAGVGRVAARSGAKKLAIKKVKSFAEDKVKGKIKGKLSKKSNLLSSEGNQQEQKLKYSSMSGELTPTLTGTADAVKIKSAPSSKSQVEQLKINVTNIHSFLVKSNKQYEKQEADTRRNETVQRSKVKFRGEERRLEKRSSPLAKSASIVKGAMQPAKSLFDKLMDFAGALLLGILVNALPAVVKKVEEIVDNIVNFLTPIQSGFNLIKGFFTGDLDESKYDADKKRFSDGMDSINEQIDKVSEKMGPLGEIIKIFKPVVDLLSTGSGGKKIVLAKQDGKEGFLNKETGTFTEKQFTSAERKRFEKGDATVDGGKPTVKADKFLDDPKGISGSQLVVTSEMGLRDLALSPGMHMGVDIAGPEGTPLVSFSRGTVTAKGYDGGYGNYVVWTDDQNIEHFYGHLKNPSPVNIGDSLIKGQIVGLMGNTGRSSGPHLHWETSTVIGDTGRPKGAVLSRFNPLSKYGKLDPFKIEQIKNSTESSIGKGGANISVKPKDMIINPDPRKRRGSMTVAVQQVNTIQMAYVPMPIPMRSRSTGSTSSPTLSPIWSA